MVVSYKHVAISSSYRRRTDGRTDRTDFTAVLANPCLWFDWFYFFFFLLLTAASSVRRRRIHNAPLSDSLASAASSPYSLRPRGPVATRRRRNCWSTDWVAVQGG